MPPILNLRFLSQTSFDSAAPSGTGVVVHRFEGDGEFQLRIHRGDEVLRRVPVNVGRGPGGGKGEDRHDHHGPGGDPHQRVRRVGPHDRRRHVGTRCLHFSVVCLAHSHVQIPSQRRASNKQ